jgi:GT2 family glycosyltransferase
MTQRFLDSLRLLTDSPYRLILVDNGSKSLPDSLIQDFASSRLVRSPENKGFGGGCNLGIAAGSHPWVAILNNDLLLTRGWLTRLTRALQKDPLIGAVAPSTNYAAGAQKIEIDTFHAEEEMHVKAGIFTERHAGCLEDVSFVTGMCILLRRSALERVGCFDERFGTGNFEDNDLCLRLKNEGMRIVVARDAFVYHRGHRTFHALGIDYHEQLKRNKRIYEEKWKQDPYFRGRVQERKGELPAALQHYRDALKTSSLNPEPLLQMGLILIHLKRFDTAVVALSGYLEKCPFSTTAQASLGQALVLSGKREEGLEKLQNVLSGSYLRKKDREKITAWIDQYSSAPRAHAQPVGA